MEAWVTLVTNDNYAVGALTLAASLKRVSSTKKLAIMITNTVSDNIKNTLGEVFDDVIAVDAMDSDDIASLTLLDRTELGITFTKVISPPCFIAVKGKSSFGLELHIC
jgi:glycogenin glucosyltransferase